KDYRQKVARLARPTSRPFQCARHRRIRQFFVSIGTEKRRLAPTSAGHAQNARASGIACRRDEEDHGEPMGRLAPRELCSRMRVPEDMKGQTPQTKVTQ